MGVQGFGETLMKGRAFCVLSLFLAPSFIMLNYEYEVMFKNGILNKKKE
jgi:hypothetical protein